MPVGPEAQLRIMLAASLDPVLEDTEIEMLLQKHILPSDYSTWAPSTAYSEGQAVVPITRDGFVYEVVTAGTSGTVQPPFSDTPNESVTDGTVEWQFSTTEEAYNLNRAASEGWRIKASKVANRYDMKNDVHTLARSQMFKHCMEMSKFFRRGAYGSVPIVTEAGAAFR
jgi:hypothetical protein